MKKFLSPSRVRSFIFGVEDSLVSTVGLLSGVAAAGMSRSSILLTGVVLIFVEAFSMGVGDILSGHAAKEYEEQAQVSLTHALPEGGVMFFSYLIAGFVPLFPYLIVEPAQAFWTSIACSLVALFMLGALGGKLAHGKMAKNGFRMAVIGGIAIALGVAAGLLVNGI